MNDINHEKIVIFCTPKFKKEWLAAVKKVSKDNGMIWSNSGSKFGRDALYEFIQSYK